MAVIVKIITNDSVFFSDYGPFESERAAAEYLRGKGWSENINGTKGLWYVQHSRYGGINAQIESLKSVDSVPKSIAFKDSRFMQVL